MDPTFVKVDYIARCIDNAVYVGLGIAILLIVPYQIRHKLNLGKITNEKAKTMSRVIWPLGLLLIGYAVFRIIVG